MEILSILSISVESDSVLMKPGETFSPPRKRKKKIASIVASAPSALIGGDSGESENATEKLSEARKILLLAASNVKDGC